MIPIKVPWTTKPPDGVGIDRSNPLTRGLVAAYAMNVSGRMVDLLGKHTSTSMTGTPTLVATAQGLATFFDADRYDIPHHADLDVTGDFSVAVGVTPTQLNQDAELVEKQLGNPLWQLRSNVDETYSFMGRDSAGTLVESRTTSKYAANVFNNLVGRKDVTTDKLTIWIDGVAEGEITDTSTGDWSNSTPLLIASGNVGSFKGNIHYIYIFQSSLSANAILAFNENPWQVFQPRTMWIPVTAAAGDDVAAALNGSLTVIADLAATGALTAAQALALSVAADLSAQGKVEAALAISMAVTAAVTGASTNDITANPSILLTATPDIDAQGRLEASNSLSISVLAGLTGSGDIQAAPTLSLSAIADLDAAGQVAAVLPIALGVLADVSADGRLVAAAQVVINASAGLEDANAPIVKAAVRMLVEAKNRRVVASPSERRFDSARRSNRFNAKINN